MWFLWLLVLIVWAAVWASALLFAVLAGIFVMVCEIVVAIVRWTGRR